VLYSAARDLELGPGTSRLEQLLESACSAFPVAALALRDESGQLIVSAGDRTRLAVVPQVMTDDDLWDDASALPVRPRRASPLPSEGMRVPLVVGHRSLGYLDLWGDGRPAGPETRRTLRALAHTVAARVAAGRNRSRQPATRTEALGLGRFPGRGARE
jgi:hypothetical protein